MDRMRKQTASDVAKYILTKQGPMTGYQVQRLLYYCQAWNLAVNGEPLFDDEIKAYEHGPVVPSVPIQHKHQYSVQAFDIEGSIDALSLEATVLIDSVLQSYGSMTGDELEMLSHSEDPWKACFNGSNGAASKTIPQESIRWYYAGLLAQDPEIQSMHHVPVLDCPKHLYVSSSDFDWLLGYLEDDD